MFQRSAQLPLIPNPDRTEVAMQAIVKVANISHGLYAAELEGQGRYGVFELFD